MFANNREGLMSLRDFSFNKAYSLGEETDISSHFLIPALARSISYKRSVGYFSCSSLLHLSQGLETLVEKGGKVRIITSPNLSDEDIRLIREGYENKEKLINKRLSEQIENEDIDSRITNANDVSRLIEKGILELKIVTRKNAGLYHDKVGILEDEEEHKVCFIGSLNETVSGYTTNYERIRVFTSWIKPENEYIEAEENEFDRIWASEHPFIDTYDFPEALKKQVISKIDHHTHRVQENPQAYDVGKEPVKLRPYQAQARDAWIENGYQGFFEMATGTGKTWTALFSIKELINNVSSVTIIIVAPYIHLVDQWSEDVNSLFPDIKTIRVSSANKNWEQQFRTEASKKKLQKEESPLIVLTTQKSFTLERFRQHLRRIPDDKMLVVDEAHRFYHNISLSDITYKYKLGLSATPFFNNNPEKSEELTKYFGGVVFKYTLEDALGTYLVNYNYYPFFVHLTQEEQERYNKVQAQIASCFQNGKLIKEPEILGSYIHKRNAILAQSEEKNDRRMEFIKQIEPQNHMIVYCGDGYTYGRDNNSQKDIRFIDQVTRELYKHNYKVHRFTSREALKERRSMIEDFTKSYIDALAAIRCLDEGVNIPSIHSALILASSNDPREFIQRRGRILRMHGNKKHANIYDVIVLPHHKDTPNVAKIELRRYYEYARLAINYEALKKQLDTLLNNYGLSYEDISDVQDIIDENKGDVLDE